MATPLKDPKDKLFTYKLQRMLINLSFDVCLFFFSCRSPPPVEYFVADRAGWIWKAYFEPIVITRLTIWNQSPFKAMGRPYKICIFHHVQYQVRASLFRHKF